MSDTSHSTETLTRWQKIKHGTVHETKKFLIATGYLAIWFYAIGLYNQSQLIHLGVDGSDTVFSVTVALIKAAIVGKFLITVEMLLPIKVNKGKPYFMVATRPFIDLRGLGHDLACQCFRYRRVLAPW